MKNVFGQSVSLALFGESHGPMVGAVLDGMAPGVEVDEERIAASLLRRRPSGSVSTLRRETDEFRIVSGVMNGRTTGTPVTILIPNRDIDSSVYAHGPVRPGHADYAAYEKYHGFEDWRGGGHFSGRVTAAIVAAGAIADAALERRGIKTGTHIAECGCVEDVQFSENPEGDIDYLREQTFPVLSREKGEEMRRAVEAAAADGDSVGGILETCVTGMPAGVGEPWFDTAEGLISHALFSIPSVKGVEFGRGFAFSKMRGSMSNDPFRLKNGRVVTSTNNSGGINGGITNGMPIVFRCVVKPASSISLPQETVDVAEGRETTITVRGRHDPCIACRACPVVDGITALVLCDLMALRYGTDWTDVSEGMYI